MSTLLEHGPNYTSVEFGYFGGTDRGIEGTPVVPEINLASARELNADKKY